MYYNIITLLYLSSSSGRRSDTSLHSAPPLMAPPIPPPVDIPPRSDEIYAEVKESPASYQVRGSADYAEDGYILNVESVPKKTFGKWKV